MKKIGEDYLIRSQKLRRKSSVAEKVMWSLLRNRNLNRYKFRRQHVIYPYIVDFICLHKKLIIELDGEHHKYQMHYDLQRTSYLNQKGYQVLRFWNQRSRILFKPSPLALSRNHRHKIKIHHRAGEGDSRLTM
jgi:very-short-patch-repair endonuclease